MFTGPVGPVEVFFYWPEAVLGIFYWPGAIGIPLASSPDRNCSSYQTITSATLLRTLNNAPLIVIVRHTIPPAHSAATDIHETDREFPFFH